MQQSGLDEAAVRCTLPFSDEILSAKKFRVIGRQYAMWNLYRALETLKVMSKPMVTQMDLIKF